MLRVCQVHYGSVNIQPESILLDWEVVFFISGNIFKASDHQIFNMITDVSLISPVHEFVKIVKFWLLKQRHDGWNIHYEHEASKVGSWTEFFDI